jgi:hypothetical protein
MAGGGHGRQLAISVSQLINGLDYGAPPISANAPEESTETSRSNHTRALLAECGEEDGVALQDNPNSCCFVVTLGPAACVGLVVLSRAPLSADRVTFLRANFDLDATLPMDRIRLKTQACLACFHLDPVFHSSARFALSEAMRQYSEKLLVYHETNPHDGMGAWAQSTPRLVLQHFTASLPRRRAQMPPDPLDADSAAALAAHVPGMPLPPPKPPPHAMSRSPTPGGLGLHYLSRSGCSAPKHVVRARVVVVGSSSSCGVACLEKLLLGAPHLFFTNVTLLLPDGLPKPLPRDVDTPTVSNNEYTRTTTRANFGVL